MKTIFNHFVAAFGDHIPAKAVLTTTSGFIMGSVGLSLEGLDLWLGIILKIMGIVAFFVTVFISMPKMAELCSKMLKAISTTFDSNEDN